MHDLPETFQAVYTSLCRMMALPFLALTIVHAIIRTRKDGEFSGGRNIARGLGTAMMLCALIAIGVTGLICALADQAVARSIGPLVAAFDKADANVVGVTLAVPAGQDALSLLARLIGECTFENIFQALANANIGQRIVFSIAVLRIPPQHGGSFLKLVEAAHRPFENLMEGMPVLVSVALTPSLVAVFTLRRGVARPLAGQPASTGGPHYKGRPGQALRQQCQAFLPPKGGDQRGQIGLSGGRCAPGALGHRHRRRAGSPNRWPECRRAARSCQGAPRQRPWSGTVRPG